VIVVAPLVIHIERPYDLLPGFTLLRLDAIALPALGGSHVGEYLWMLWG